jgi:hypothetical protein
MMMMVMIIIICGLLCISSEKVQKYTGLKNKLRKYGN